jgi:Phage-related terminase
MFSVQQRYEPELFGMEKGMIERSLGPFLRAEMIKRGVYINIHYLPPTKDKQARARSLQARMRAGGVRFDKSADWYPALEQEMLRFPRDRHDDQVDALSWIGLMLDLFEEAPTKEELEEQEYEEMVNEFPSGRSAVCGY